MKKVNYDPLWALLNKLGIQQKVLKEDAHISSSTLQKLRCNQNVNIESLTKICTFLNCDYEDIVTCEEREK